MTKPTKGSGLLKPSIDWLLILAPISVLFRFWAPWRNETALFICSGLAIIPLAALMGRATEELSEHLGPGRGALLNATFGNAAELIISIMALAKGLSGVVKASITGSIIGNILLVLGVSMIAGGTKYAHQKFNRTAARSSNTSLTLAAIALLIPTVFHHVAGSNPAGWTPAVSQKLSLAIAIVLFMMYGFSLRFSLKTHKQLFAGPTDAAVPSGRHGAGWSPGKACFVLFLSTILVAFMSEFLVGSVEAARARLGFTEVFVGVIVVAIIGNAAEHSTAVVMALKNKMDLSVGIAVGSSLQIALFVAPVLVFVSYFIGKPMDLEFTIPEVVAVAGAVHIVGQVSGDGESNWLEGVQLVSVYLILAILFFFLPATGGH